MDNSCHTKITNDPFMSLNKSMSLFALSLGSFIVIMDVTIVNVALPAMSKDLHGSVSWLQWVVDGYTLTFACLLLSSGNLADRVGAKSTYVFGLILFVLTSLACGFASDFLFLTLMRLLQGVGAALLTPTSLVLVNASYANVKERVKAISIWGMTGAIAAAIGPILGGLLTFYCGWRWIFFVNIPFGLLALFLTKKYVVNLPPSGKGHFDISGQTLAVISIGALAFALIEAGRMGFYSHIVIASFIIFVITFIAFLSVENKTSSPLFPLHFFRSRTFSVAMTIGMISTTGWYGELFVLTLYFQHIRDYSVLMTGFAFIPFVGMNALSAFLGGKLASVVGSRLPILCGLAISVAGYFSMLIAGAHTPYALLILPLVGIGAGIAFLMPALTVTAIHAVPEGRTGIASGALNACRQIGILMGVAVFGTIIAVSNNFIVAMHETLMIAGLLCFVGFFAVFLWIKKENT